MIANPKIFTKELKLQANAATGERWLRCSSNLLRGFGFAPGARVARVLIGAGQEGLRFTLDREGGSAVYERRYRGRNNAREAQLDLKSPRVINAAFPSYIDRVHFTFQHGQIVARPVPNQTFNIRQSFRAQRGPMHAFMSMSAGVDARCMMDAGFHVTGLLEWRPPEARDRQDLTETGVLTAAANIPTLEVVFNENVMTIDWRRVEEVMRGRPPVGCLHLSLACDDFSSLKGVAARARSVEELTTSADMMYDALRMIEVIRPASVVVEQVRGFAEKLGYLMEVKLRRWGYSVQSGIFAGSEHGGATNRTRYYMVASVFPGFVFPMASVQRNTPVWTLIADQIEKCSDVTASKTVAAARISPRGFAPLTPQSRVAPTLIKSQSHAPKDALYLKTDDGRVLLPNTEVLRRLNGIPGDFDFSEVTQAIAMEQIGQSIEYPMHHRIVRAVFAHLQANSAGEMSQIARVTLAPAASAEAQLSLEL